MPFCGNCGAYVGDSQRFCSECGMRLQPEQILLYPPPPPPPGDKTTISVSPPKPQNNNISKPTSEGSQSNIHPPKQGILGRVNIDQENVDRIAEKVKKVLGEVWRIARKGISKGAELASQRIDAAKDTIEEKQERQQVGQVVNSINSHNIKFCSNCGQPVALGNFCNYCGHKLE